MGFVRFVVKIIGGIGLNFLGAWITMLCVGIAHTLNGAHAVPAFGFWPVFWLVAALAEVVSVAVVSHELWSDS